MGRAHKSEKAIAGFYMFLCARVLVLDPRVDQGSGHCFNFDTQFILLISRAFHVALLTEWHWMGWHRSQSIGVESKNEYQVEVVPSD